jgi:hypothetical protein
MFCLILDGLDEWGDDAVLNQVLAVSQHEYLNSLMQQQQQQQGDTQNKVILKVTKLLKWGYKQCWGSVSGSISQGTDPVPSHRRKESDPELVPDPLVRGTVLWIRIRTRMSRIPRALVTSCNLIVPVMIDILCLPSLFSISLTGGSHIATMGGYLVRNSP